MHNDDHTNGFTMENPYEEEAKQRWGHTDAYKQSQERVKNMTKEDWDKHSAETDDFMKKIAALAEKNADPSSAEVQEQIARHFNSLRTFYEPGLEMYRGLADMYVGDPRFAAFYDKYRPGLAVFMRDAMHAYANAQEKA